MQIADLTGFIDEALRRKERFILAVDGLAGAGKSRLAVDLAERYSASLIRLDHFFLPLDARDRNDAYPHATHMDFDRFLAEVGGPLSRGEAGSYGVFSCATQSLTGSRRFGAAGLIVIEGSYALHPAIAHLHDASVFLPVDSAAQKDRLRRREGERYETFAANWLTRETAYHEAFCPEDRADLSSDMTTVKDTVLYLVRHGVTEGNRRRRIQGHLDVSLNDDGREQARQLAIRLADYHIDHFFASDLSRAVETADIIRQNHPGSPLPLNAGLREISMGDMEGRTFEECFALYPEIMAAMKNTPLDVSTPGGETSGAVLDRARTFVSGAIESHPGNVLLAVSHGYILNLFVQSHAAAAGLRLPATVFGNTSLTKLIFRDGQLSEVPLQNDQSHLT